MNDSSTMTLKPEIKKFRLAVYCVRPDDATSLYRGLGPLGAMERAEPRLELVLPPVSPAGRELTWDWLWRCEALLVQRPYDTIHAQLLVQAQLMGVPVWVDWDDDYLAVHPSHREARLFKFAGAAACQEQLTTMADVVTVTTEELAKVVRARDKGGKPDHKEARKPMIGSKGGQEGKVRVIPNACQWPFMEGERARRVCWRGAHAHGEDVLGVLPQIAELARLTQFGKWEWAFLGEPPWQVAEVMPRERLLGDFGAEPWLYMEALGRLRPWVVIVPLADYRFNHCKSNLAWIEATAAGAIVLAPGPGKASQWEEWQRPGIVHYHNREEFGSKLREVMTSYTNAGNFSGHVAASRKYLQQELMLGQVNQLRWEILNELWEKRNGRT